MLLHISLTNPRSQGLLISLEICLRSLTNRWQRLELELEFALEVELLLHAECGHTNSNVCQFWD
jgi:hypothetical protein